MAYPLEMEGYWSAQKIKKMKLWYHQDKLRAEQALSHEQSRENPSQGLIRYYQNKIDRIQESQSKIAQMEMEHKQKFSLKGGL